MFYAMKIEAERTRERTEREFALAAARRLTAPEPTRSIRRAIGRRFIRIGTRIAAEPSFESVRSL